LFLPSFLHIRPSRYDAIVIEETGKTLGDTFPDPEQPPIINLVELLDLKFQDVVALYETKMQEELSHLLVHAKEYIDGLTVERNSVVVFDIDDTVLTTYPEMEAREFRTIPKLDIPFLLDNPLPAIPQTRDFFEYLVETKGINVIFLSERQSVLHRSTVNNLEQQGFHHYSRLIMRGKDESLGSCFDFKSRWRKRIVAEGQDIICCVGDQQSDLCGGNTGLAVKIPNYLYSAD
jgi:hypothetical protein